MIIGFVGIIMRQWCAMGKKMMGKNGDRNNEEWRNHSGIIMEYGDSNGIFMGISI